MRVYSIAIFKHITAIKPIKHLYRLREHWKEADEQWSLPCRASARRVFGNWKTDVWAQRKRITWSVRNSFCSIAPPYRSALRKYSCGRKGYVDKPVGRLQHGTVGIGLSSSHDMIEIHRSLTGQPYGWFQGFLQNYSVWWKGIVAAMACSLPDCSSHAAGRFRWMWFPGLC